MDTEELQDDACFICGERPMTHTQEFVDMGGARHYFVGVCDDCGKPQPVTGALDMCFVAEAI